MIEFQNVFKQYGAQAVLSDANVRILSGDRIGVVGPNGAGKTTLFRLIIGSSTPDKGDVKVAANVRIGYLRQVLNNQDVDMPLTDYVADAVPALREIETRIHAIEHDLPGTADQSARDALLKELGHLQTEFEQQGGYVLRTKAEAALGGLGFAADTLMKPLRDFSGGWQMRAELARVLIANPDILLLDEPSNYLDLPAVEWLQRFLRGFNGTLVLISHDRYLLNTLTRDTLEINSGRCTMYAGTYDAYRAARQERQAQLLARKKNQDQKRKQVERFVERFRAKNTKATQVQSRIKMLAKMDEVDVPDALQTRGRIRLAAPPPCGVEVMRLEQAGITYDGARWVLRGVDCAIQRGEKTALVGLNGLGKTTLLRLLAGALPLSEGHRVVGHRVTPGYQTQDFAESMPANESAFAVVRAMAPDAHEQDIRTLLGGFGFSGTAIEKPVSVLSGGEKIRLAFARLLVKPPNFLLLDEPTTHLDIQAREALEEALSEYEGTLCFVSHDVEFVRRVATGIIAMEPPGIRRYAGGYDYYLEKAADGAPPSSTTPVAASGKDRKAMKRERARQVQERSVERRRWEKVLREAEAKVMELEAEQEALVTNLETGEQARSFSEINQRLSQLPEEIAEWTRKWEEAAEGLRCLDFARHDPCC